MALIQEGAMGIQRILKHVSNVGCVSFMIFLGYHLKNQVSP